MRKKRIVVVCPGRGSYTRETSNYLENVDSNLRAIIEEQDKIRSAKKLKSVFELDKTIFRAKTHMTGENASPLIYSCSLNATDLILTPFKSELRQKLRYLTRWFVNSLIFQGFHHFFHHRMFLFHQKEA